MVIFIAEQHKNFRKRLKEKHQKSRLTEVDSSDEEEQMDTVLHMPSFIENNHVMNPIIELKLTLDGDQFGIENADQWFGVSLNIFD